jgi:hypothetical protein
MKRKLLITLFVIIFSSLATHAQSCTPANPYTDRSGWVRWCSCMGGHIEQVSGNPACVGANGSGGGGGNPELYNGFYQLGYRFGCWLGGGCGSNTNAADEALRQQQQQQMMEELRRREEEAARQHQEEEARRLAAMYNRLAGTLKLSGLPHLELKVSGIPAGGLQLKMGDSAQGYGIPGLPGIYTGGPAPTSAQPSTGSGLHLKMGDSAAGTGQTPANGQQGYGIPGLPGIYTGGPGPGSALPPPSQAGLQLKMGDGSAATQAPAAGASGTPDFSKMTPQQLADAADAFSKLPPEEQQRAMAGGQASSSAPQQAPTLPTKGATAEEMKDAPASQSAPEAASASATTPQTASQPIAGLQGQANASQSAATAPVLEDASAKARVGFDTTSVPGPVQLGATNTPASILPPQGSPSNPSVATASANSAPTPLPSTTGPDNTPHKVDDSIMQLLFPADQRSISLPRDPNPQLNNPLREDEKQEAELKAWDDWAIQRATHINGSHTEPGQIAYPQGTVQAELNRSAVQQYAPELLNRYNTDAAFRQSVDVRLQYTNENVALAYYHGLADAHKSAIVEFHAELDQLKAANKLDLLTPLDEQYRLHPERRQLVQSAWDRATADEQAALAKAQAEGNAAVEKEYKFAFQLIRGRAAQQ